LTILSTLEIVVPGLIGTPRPKQRPGPAHHLTHGTITGQAIHARGGACLGA